MSAARPSGAAQQSGPVPAVWPAGADGSQSGPVPVVRPAAVQAPQANAKAVQQQRRRWAPQLAKRETETRRMAANAKRELEKRKRMAFRFVSVVVLAAVFCAGFFLRGNSDLMARVGIGSETASSQPSGTVAITGTVYDSFSVRLAEVEDIINEQSLDSYDLETTTANLMNALADSTEDPYFRYFNQERYELYVNENTSKKYEGVGVLFAEYEGRAYAADVFSDSQADLAGVQEGDVVQAINGDASKQWTTGEVNALINDSDKEVTITWLRNDSLSSEGGKQFTTTLAIKEYKAKNVTFKKEDDDIGYIKVTQLTQNAADLVQSAVANLEEDGAKAFVLDLRGCSGGYLSQAVDIASLFMESGTVVQVKTAESTSARQVSGSTITSAPLVVLVNDKTAAAAEVLAAAFSDNERATLVGATTQGKGSVQVVQTLSFGGAVRYTVAYYISPQGHDINDKGVTPDTPVSGSDTQLNVALQTAVSKLG